MPPVTSQPNHSATEQPTSDWLGDVNEYCRAEEFRSALDSYLAGYAEYQKDCGEIRRARRINLARCVDWPDGCSRPTWSICI
jgi:hypothetical protein